MNVLSLFDGMSCAQIALERAGIKVDNYYASEIDKYAIEIASKNYPDTKYFGDVHMVNALDLPVIDILIGGSPCQDLSLAGKGQGLKGERSGLFFEYVRLLKECKPKYFILENVKMKQEYQDIISEELGVQPILIDSALVSAQSRKRLYWTNLDVAQPKDRGLVLADVLECETTDYIKISKRGRYKQRQDKASCLSGGAHSGGNHSDMDLIGRPLDIGRAEDIRGIDMIKRIYSKWGKSPTITTISGGHQHKKVAVNNYEYRRLTPLECERLQTVPDGYTHGVSNTQRYKMLGNGFTVDVIAHILRVIL